jgi:FlaA1/EpsC-like NDP-sugar epimerase
LRKNVADKVVVVTGAGGSIGSELCRQILAVGPSILVLVDHSEFALYAIHRELEAKSRQLECKTEIVPFLASVQDKTRMRELFKRWTPTTIYHAAAYKHVPMIEQNILEGVRNNVFGTYCLVQLAMQFGICDFVLISTDKAVRPTNVMGASKRLAELILQACAAQELTTCFSMVRFGNVLGSSGSVVPLFRQQIAAGGPLTLTDPNMTRYFMTIPEASQLVIQAGAMATGGEVFVLDMGEPVRIYDLAVNMIELSGLSVRDKTNPDGDIEIQVVGLRPGEKLYEELLIGGDPTGTPHKRIWQAREQFLAWPELEPQLANLCAELDKHDVDGVLASLRRLVPEFEHQPLPLGNPDDANRRIASPASLSQAAALG